MHALLAAGAKPVAAAPFAAKDGELPPLPLHLATKADDAQSIRLLSRNKADLNATLHQSPWEVMWRSL